MRSREKVNRFLFLLLLFAVLWGICFFTSCSGYSTDWDQVKSGYAIEVADEFETKKDFEKAEYFKSGFFKNVDDNEKRLTGWIIIAFETDSLMYRYSHKNDSLFLSNVNGGKPKLTFVGENLSGVLGYWHQLGTDDYDYFWLFKEDSVEVRRSSRSLASN